MPPDASPPPFPCTPFLPPAAPAPNLTSPLPPHSPRAGVFRREPLPPAVPGAAPPPGPVRGVPGSECPPAGGTRAPPAAATREAAGRRAGRRQGRGVRKHVLRPWDRGKRALSVLKLLAASVVSAIVSSRGSHAALPGTARGGCAAGGCGGAARCTPPSRSRG